MPITVTVRKYLDVHISREDFAYDVRFLKYKTNPALVLNAFLNAYIANPSKKILTINDIGECTCWCTKKIGLRGALKNLSGLGLVEQVFRSPYEIMESLTVNVSPPKEKHCPWCKTPCRLLDKHHWPLTQKMGGKNIVQICKPCHVEYHKIDRTKAFSPTGLAISMFEEWLAEVEKRCANN